MPDAEREYAGLHVGEQWPSIRCRRCGSLAVSSNASADGPSRAWRGKESQNLCPAVELLTSELFTGRCNLWRFPPAFDMGIRHIFGRARIFRYG